MEELTKILKDEAWLESEKRGKYVPLYDEHIFNRSIEIWESQYQQNCEETGGLNE